MEVARDFDDFRREFGDDETRRVIDGARPLAAISAGDAEHKGLVSATPYVCRDPTTIPPRQWVYGRQLLRGSLSLVVAPGATGKTALLAGTALAISTGRDLLGKQVWGGPKRVWLWNLEDSGEELSRMIEGGRKHWGICPDDIGDRLFVDSALDGAELCLARQEREGFRINEPIVEALVDELRAREIDVLIVDPFVSSHACPENDNGAIDAIAKKWARVGVMANCSIVLVHHTGKLAGAEASAEKARGASSLTGAARSVIALNKMTDQEASGYGIEGEDRRRYFRAYDDKNNRAPPADQSDWFQILGVDLGNGRSGRAGDSVPVVVPWAAPDAFDGVTEADLARVQEMVAAGSYRKDAQAADWVGHAVAHVVGLNLDRESDKARAKKLLRTWFDNDALGVEDRHCSQARRQKSFVVVGGSQAASPSAPR